MKTPEDEAFEDIERRQGGGFPAKRAMAADKQNAELMEWCQAAMDKINSDFDKEYIKYREAYREAFFKGHIVPHQEPVAWMCSDQSLLHKGYSWFSSSCGGAWNIPVYTTPPKRPWVGLTNEDRKAVLLTAYKEWECEELLLCAREDYLLIEQALKEKNT